MTFKVEKSDLKGVLLIQPAVHNDSRGRFFESFQKKRYKELGIEEEFVQDSHSISQKSSFQPIKVFRKKGIKKKR